MRRCVRQSHAPSIHQLPDVRLPEARRDGGECPPTIGTLIHNGVEALFLKP